MITIVRFKYEDRLNISSDINNFDFNHEGDDNRNQKEKPTLFILFNGTIQ